MCFNAIWDWLTNNASTIIAFCAFVLTIWQFKVQRTHNKLSVKPYLTTWSHRGEDDGLLRVDVLNNGIGPALIKCFKVYVDSHEVEGQDLEIVRKAVKLLFPNYNYTIPYNSFLSEGYMMTAKEERCLVSISFTGPNFPTDAEIEHATKRVRIFISYESIYKDSFDYDSSKFGILN